MALNEGIVLLSVAGVRERPLEVLKPAYIALLERRAARRPDDSMFTAPPAPPRCRPPRNGHHTGRRLSHAPSAILLSRLLGSHRGRLSSWHACLSAAASAPSAEPPRRPDARAAAPVTAQTATARRHPAEPGLQRRHPRPRAGQRPAQGLRPRREGPGRRRQPRSRPATRSPSSNRTAPRSPPCRRGRPWPAPRPSWPASSRCRDADDVAAAEAALTQQQVKLQNMLTGGRAEDIQVAQAALDAQQARLDLMLQGGRPEAVQQAQAGLDAANAKLAAVQKGATERRLAGRPERRRFRQGRAGQRARPPTPRSAARLPPTCKRRRARSIRLTASVQAAQSAVASADAALNNLQGSAPADVAQAQTRLRSGPGAARESPRPRSTRPTIRPRRRSRRPRRRSSPRMAQRQSAEAQQTALEQGVDRAVRRQRQPSYRSEDLAQLPPRAVTPRRRRPGGAGRQRGRRSRPGPAGPAPPRRHARRRRPSCRPRSTRRRPASRPPDSASTRSRTAASKPSARSCSRSGTWRRASSSPGSRT